MAITTQDIHAVADQIAGTGETPTLSAIRKAIGGGSYTTISDAMKEWKAAHHAEVAKTLIRESAPPAITNKLTELGADIWATSIELANERLQTERDGMEATRKEMEVAQKEAADLADHLAAELENAQAIIKQQEKSLQVELIRNVEYEKIIESEKKLRLDAERTAETTVAALSESHDHLKMLNDTVEHLKAENADLKAEITTLKAENKIFSKDVGDFSFDNKSMKIMIDNLKKIAETAQANEDQAKQAKNEAELKLARVTGELTGELKAINAENKSLKEKHAELQIDRTPKSNKSASRQSTPSHEHEKLNKEAVELEEPDSLLDWVDTKKR